MLFDLLERLGVSVLPGRADQEGPGANLPEGIESPPGLYFDWSKTRAFALPWAYDGYLRINQRGREPGGIVAPGAEREQLLAEIERAVRALRIAGTDEPAAKVVVRAQEAVSRRGIGRAAGPDGVVEQRASLRRRRIRGRSAASKTAIPPAVPSIRRRAACSRTDRSSPPVPRFSGARDFDIAPTVLRSAPAWTCPATSTAAPFQN